MSPIFGFLAFLNYQKYFEWVKKILIGTYGMIAVISLGFASIISVFSIIVIIILIPLILSVKIKQNNLGLYFLVNNGLILTFLIGIMLILMQSKSGFRLEKLLEFWN